MKSCRFNWTFFIGVFLLINVISSAFIVEGRPQQQQHRRPFNTFNLTLVPYPQYQPYNQPYQRYNQQYQFYQNNRASRNISSYSNNYQQVFDPTVYQQGAVNSQYHSQPVVDQTLPDQQQQQEPAVRYQPQNSVTFKNNRELSGPNPTAHSGVFQHDVAVGNQMVNGSSGEADTGIRREENSRRDVRNSTVVHLPAGGPESVVTPSAKEKTRILTHHVNPSRGPLSEDLRGTQDIIFPDSFENLFDPITRLDTVPQCARGAVFCEDIPTYPYQQIRDTLRRTTVNADLFFADEEDTLKEITNRISGIEETKYICKSVERTIYPKVGMTKNNKWKYIINQNQEGYIQGVRVETCLYADRPCDFSENMPLGVVTSCKQKYVTRRMMSLADDGAPLPDVFLMPSACCCSYRMENPLLRGRMADSTPVPE